MERRGKSLQATSGHKPVGTSKLREFAKRGGVQNDSDFMEFLNAIVVDRVNGHADHDMATDLTHSAREMRVFAVQKQTFALRQARTKEPSSGIFSLIDTTAKKTKKTTTAK